MRDVPAHATSPFLTVLAKRERLVRSIHQISDLKSLVTGCPLPLQLCPLAMTSVTREISSRVLYDLSASTLRSMRFQAIPRRTSVECSVGGSTPMRSPQVSWNVQLNKLVPVPSVVRPIRIRRTQGKPAREKEDSGVILRTAWNSASFQALGGWSHKRRFSEAVEESSSHSSHWTSPGWDPSFDLRASITSFC